MKSKRVLTSLCFLTIVLSVFSQTISIIDLSTLSETNKNVSLEPTIPEENEQRWFFDVWTGERYPTDMEMDDYPFIISENERDDKLIEIRLPGFIIEKTDVENTELWLLPRGSAINRTATSLLCVPSVNLSTLLLTNHEDDVYIYRDGEYVDFDNINLATNSYYIEPYTNEFIYGDPEPYEGFWPEDCTSPVYPKMNGRDQYDRKLVKYEFHPVQYDYENKIARVYRKMTFKRVPAAYISGVENFENDPNNGYFTELYYTIDGRPEPNPKEGKIYLVNRNGQWSKIIYK